MHASDYLRYLIRNKLQLLYCSLSVYLLLFTASYYLRIRILWSVLSLWSVIFKATNTNQHPAFFQCHQHLEERNITFS